MVRDNPAAGSVRDMSRGYACRSARDDRMGIVGRAFDDRMGIVGRQSGASDDRMGIVGRVGVARGMAVSEALNVGPRDVVPLVALVALMVAPAVTLVTERPAPPWSDEHLLAL